MATKNDGGSYQLLLEAESWPASVLEERAVELVNIVTSRLVSSDSSYDVRMDCLRWIGDKLVGYIYVGDLEELLLKTFLNSALDYLEEIMRACEKTSQQNKLVLIKSMISILQHSNKVRVI